MKMFVGPQVRRAREERGLTQAALARLVDISPSYLNQIERNQRPLTVPVLLRMSEAIGLDAQALPAEEGARLVADLGAALSDPAVGGGEVPAAEIRELVQGFPAVARAVVVLHRRASDARRRAEEMAIGLGARLSEGERLPVIPYDEVLDFVYDNRNHFPALDAAAEELGGDRVEGLLAARHGVHVIASDDAADRRRFDRASRTLELPRALTGTRRTFQLAVQWCLLEHGETLDRLTDVPGLSGPESRALARIGLANYFAGAVVLPYRAFLAEAEATGYDVGLLCDRFGVSIETVCHRLSTMQRPGLAGVPFFFVRVDRAGNISKRHSATDFHFSRIGGTCPLWCVYEAFSSPGRFLTQIARMPDGRAHLWVARTIGRRLGAYGRPGVEFAVALGCDVRHAPRLVYARGMALDDPAIAVPIGPGCRLCERDACPQRAFPLVGRPLHIDEDRGRREPYPAADAPA